MREEPNHTPEPLSPSRGGSAYRVPICQKLCLLCLLLSGVSLRAAEWRWLVTPHFLLLSNTADTAARDALIELEEFRSAFLIFSRLTPEVPQRTIVVLFATEAEFNSYKPLYRRKRKDVAGYFKGTDINAFMVLALGPDQDSNKRVLYHEYVHSLYHEVGWEPPLWFNEGSAEVFSTFQVKGGIAEIGRIPPWHLSLLRQERLMPLASLFAVTHESPEYNESRQQGMFYAESWALAHFLIYNGDPALRAKFHAALVQLGSGDAAAFQAALGISLADLQSQLDAYIYRGSFQFFKEPFNKTDAVRAIKTKVMDPVERDCILGVVGLNAKMPADAAYSLRLLWERFPTSPLPHEIRAMHALQEGEFQLGEEELFRAVELNTSNLRTYWYLARLLGDTWLTSDLTPYKRIEEETARHLRSLIQRVLQEYPGAMETWEEWARTEAFAPSPQPAALDAIEGKARASKEDPHALKMLMWVAFARMRLGDDAAAGKLAAAVDGSPDASENTRKLNRYLLSRYFRVADDDHPEGK
jgi:hypothetical protein